MTLFWQRVVVAPGRSIVTGGGYNSGTVAGTFGPGETAVVAPDDLAMLFSGGFAVGPPTPTETIYTPPTPQRILFDGDFGEFVVPVPLCGINE